MFAKNRELKAKPSGGSSAARTSRSPRGSGAGGRDHPPVRPRARAGSGPGARRTREEVEAGRARGVSVAHSCQPRTAPEGPGRGSSESQLGARKHFPSAPGATRHRAGRGGARARRGGPGGAVLCADTKGRRRGAGARRPASRGVAPPQPPAGARPGQAPGPGGQTRQRTRPGAGGGTRGREIKSQERPLPQHEGLPWPERRNAVAAAFPAAQPVSSSPPGPVPSRAALTGLSRRFSKTTSLSVLWSRHGQLRMRAPSPGPCW